MKIIQYQHQFVCGIFTLYFIRKLVQILAVLIDSISMTNRAVVIVYESVKVTIVCFKESNITVVGLKQTTVLYSG